MRGHHFAIFFWPDKSRLSLVVSSSLAGCSIHCNTPTAIHFLLPCHSSVSSVSFVSSSSSLLAFFCAYSLHFALLCSEREERVLLVAFRCSGARGVYAGRCSPLARCFDLYACVIVGLDWLGSILGMCCVVLSALYACVIVVFCLSFLLITSLCCLSIWFVNFVSSCRLRSLSLFISFFFFFFLGINFGNQFWECIVCVAMAWFLQCCVCSIGVCSFVFVCVCVCLWQWCASASFVK